MGDRIKIHYEASWLPEVGKDLPEDPDRISYGGPPVLGAGARFLVPIYAADYEKGPQDLGHIACLQLFVI